MLDDSHFHPPAVAPLRRWRPRAPRSPPRWNTRQPAFPPFPAPTSARSSGTGRARRVSTPGSRVVDAMAPGDDRASDWGASRPLCRRHRHSHGVDGMAAYRALKVPPATVWAWTPSSGGHVYCRWPGEGWCNTVGAIADGIDTRGEGGYVIAPPSMAANGAYRWVADGMKQRLLAGQASEPPEVLRLRVDLSAVHRPHRHLTLLPTDGWPPQWTRRWGAFSARRRAREIMR